MSAKNRLTLGDLRKLVKLHKDAPGGTPVVIRVPVEIDAAGPRNFWRRRNGWIAYDHVYAEHVEFEAVSYNEDGSVSGSEFYIPPKDRSPEEDWEFLVKIDVNLVSYDGVVGIPRVDC